MGVCAGMCRSVQALVVGAWCLVLGGIRGLGRLRFLMDGIVLSI